MCPCTNIFLSNCANVQLCIVWFPKPLWIGNLRCLQPPSKKCAKRISKEERGARPSVGHKNERGGEEGARSREGFGAPPYPPNPPFLCFFVLVLSGFHDCANLKNSPHTYMCIRFTIVLTIFKWISINTIHVNQMLANLSNVIIVKLVRITRLVKYGSNNLWSTCASKSFLQVRWIRDRQNPILMSTNKDTSLFDFENKHPNY